MAERQKAIYFEVALKRYIKDCTCDFFKDEDFPKEFAIAEIFKDIYGLVDLQEKKCTILFTRISKLAERVYVLYSENDYCQVVKLPIGCEMRVSRCIKKIIKRFKDYILVEDMSGQRKLMSLYFSENMDLLSWIKCTDHGDEKEHNNVILELPNGRKSILLKEGLITKDIEFDYLEKEQEEDKDYFRIVGFTDEESQAVIRMNDLEESYHFDQVEPLEHSSRGIFSEYLKVSYCHTIQRNQQAILRISDFKISESYSTIYGLSWNYAEIFDGNGSGVIRLSDFAEAKWLEKNPDN